MACTSPLAGWKSATINPTGKRSVLFTLNGALVDSPVDLPCGKCLGCRADQALMWSIRAYHESTLHARNSFVTLTYDDEHLPADGKIVKKDLQDFFKRARHNFKFRYIACGEYGEASRRPHYHAIIFGEDFADYVNRHDLGEAGWTHTQLEKDWGKGHVLIAPCTLASVMYTCGYVNKKIGDADTFMLCSRRPGIGSDWLKKYKDDIRRTGTVSIEGREFAVPPRYLVWEENYLQEVKALRKEHALKSKEKYSGIFDRQNLDMNRKAALKRKKETL